MDICQCLKCGMVEKPIIVNNKKVCPFCKSDIMVNFSNIKPNNNQE